MLSEKMNEQSHQLRMNIIGHIGILASASAQTDYERDVPIADVPGELICGFVDDIFHPKNPIFLDAFIEDELKDLAELYGMICVANRSFKESSGSGVKELLKLPEWRAVMNLAKDLVTNLERNKG